MATLLLFGASGAIGGAIRTHFEGLGWRVVGAGRRAQPGAGADIAYDPLTAADGKALTSAAPYDAVCWAQGANGNDSVYNVDIAKHRALYEANCLFVVQSLQHLLAHKLLAKPARLCVISSIWQEMARQEKLSYCMTKAALKGLVLSAAADLARDGHLINAVLPGVLDTPMTRANLTPAQIAVFENATGFKRLPQLADVAHAVESVLSARNHSITGQFIEVDLGFSHVRIV
jgi:3-oxoacyl-[acyl-carrier protein] reductase